MIYEKNGAPALSASLFANPTKEYRGAPFWSWNTRVTPEMVDEQIAVYKEMGMGGFHIHARTGLETPYMGEEFLSLVKRADARAKENDMLCYLYDEDRYPSGAAGGIVTEDLRYRQRFLVLSVKYDGTCPQNRAAFEQQIDAGEKPQKYYITSYEVVLDADGCLQSYRQADKDAVSENGTIWHLYLSLSPESPWFNDQTYVDVFNKKAIERFLEVTHERYYKTVGDEFGRSIPSIFTDEPQMAGKFSFATPFDKEDATLSFTDDMNDTYKAAYGVELLAILPEILWELPGGQVSVHRYHYHDHLAERFASAFSDTLGAWCGAHNLALTGHFMSERTLFSQTLALEDAMRLYRSFQLPGIDILTDAKEFTTAKQAVSVARQDGREGVMCECYGAMNWDFDFKGHKLQGDWLAALGITLRCHHLTFMSMEGESKRDWPASIGYQSPWYTKYAYVEDHFARVNTALTRGRALVNVGVLYPIESYWISYGPNAQTQMKRDQLDDNYEKIIRWLLFGTIDFDLIDESLLPDRCDPDKICDTLADGRVSLPVGKMAYEAIVVPGLLTIRSTTLDRLEAFVDAGGTVVFAGHVPALVDAMPSDRAEKLAARCVCVEYERAQLLHALQPYRLVELRQKRGQLTENLIYQMRTDGDSRWLFICHVERTRNVVDVPELCNITIKGVWKPMLYDTLTGTITPCAATVKNGNTLISRKLYGEESLLIKLEPGEPAADAPKQVLPDAPRHKVRTPDRFTIDEPNVLVLDFAEFAFDGGEWQPKADILTIDNKFRKQLHMPRRQDKFTQPWRLPDEKPEHTVAMRFTFDSEIEVADACLAMERPENAKIVFNGTEITAEPVGWFTDKCIKKVPLPVIKAGTNELLLTIPFGRKTNLEWCYILGNFGVGLAGDFAWIREMPKQLHFGDMVHQGLPFYTGNLTYEMEVTIPEDKERVIIEIPHFAASVMEIFWNGESRGVVAYAPHKLELGAVKAGTYTLGIKVFGNRFNAFGTFHNADDEYRWYGPDAYRVTGTQWSDSYLCKPYGVLSSIYVLYK